MMKRHEKSYLMEIWEVFGTLSHVVSQSLFRNGAFYRVVCWSFSQSVISEIHYLWPSSFPLKCLKFDVDSRNGTKNSENVSRFWDKCIWTRSWKFSQCTIGYLASAVNVLRNTYKISSDSRGDILLNNFFQNYWNTF